MAVAGAALVCAGCPVADMAGTPEWTTYGKIKTDFALNSNGATTPADGSTMRFVNNITPDPDGTLSMTAQDTRFGAKLDMGVVKGLVEVDFHGTDVNFRHAYVTLDLGNDMKLLAGQTWDVFSPLNPGMLNYTVGWDAGNVGHRSPQFRWEWAPEMGLIDSVQASFSDPNDTRIIMPDIQARVGFRLTEAVNLGASIVLGSVDVGNDGTEEDIFGLAVDVKAKLGDNLAIVGEWHSGQNLDDYMGNIDVGIPNNDEVGCDGLWVAVVITPADNLTVNAGLMFETNDDGDIGAGTRSDNSCIFGNAIWHLNEQTDVGIEISKWETEYKAAATEFDNLRIQGSVIVKF